MDNPNNGQPLTIVPALCLDIDGTVRRSKAGHTFIQDANDIELMPGIENIIREFYTNDWLIFGVSNQAGVAHGFKTVPQINEEMEATLNLFKTDCFHLIKTCYFDPKGKVAPFNVRSLLRKPDYGMLAVLEDRASMNGYIVDWDKSLFVGDRPEDSECASRAGIPFMHINTFLTHIHFPKIIV